MGTEHPEQEIPQPVADGSSQIPRSSVQLIRCILCVPTVCQALKWVLEVPH